MASTGTERITFDGRPAWRKSYGPPRRLLRMLLLRWVARALRLTPLLPPPAPLTGSSACATERAAIEHLHAIGVCAPDVLAASETELVLSDLGQTLSARCKAESDPARREDWIRRGFEAIGDLHRRDGHVSQAFARNLVCSGDAIGFIDLEENPLEAMPLPAAQARDLLLYVSSTARFIEHDRYAALLHDHMAGEAPAVRAEIVRVARRLRWLAPLARLGASRGRALAAALDVLARCAIVIAMLLLAGLGDEAVQAASYLLADHL
jgi:tRNA A-37 threonylcarbamoyl transferase component Bud32